MKPAMTNLSPQPRIEEAILDDCEGVFTQSDKAGHPRLAVLEGAKSWVAGPGPAMTQGQRPRPPPRQVSASADQPGHDDLGETSPLAKGRPNLPAACCRIVGHAARPLLLCHGWACARRARS